uniref:Uncharacterized protein LOC105043849 n=1 Tax=Elaeis guineensis var. tenera TaxID=51953 RepID=A0A8N4F6A6_ELAGV|nr:uncharacterized protein LOC105043849 [Elaeis guineensis]
MKRLSNRLSLVHQRRRSGSRRSRLFFSPIFLLFLPPLDGRLTHLNRFFIPLNSFSLREEARGVEFEDDHDSSQEQTCRRVRPAMKALGLNLISLLLGPPGMENTKSDKDVIC